jgi:hypothetical protein
MYRAMPQIWQLIGLMRNSPGLAGMVMNRGGQPQQIPQMPGGGVPGAPRPMGMQASGAPGGGVGSAAGQGGLPNPYLSGGLPSGVAGRGMGGGQGGGGQPPGPYMGGVGGQQGGPPPGAPGIYGSVSPQATAQMGMGAAQAGMNSQLPIPSLEQVLAGIQAADNPSGLQSYQDPMAPEAYPDPSPYADPESMTGPNGSPTQDRIRPMPGGPSPGNKPKQGRGRGVPTPKPRPKGLLGDQNGPNQDGMSWMERNFWESTKRTGNSNR